jgi:hypothetical protein
MPGWILRVIPLNPETVNLISFIFYINSVSGFMVFDSDNFILFMKSFPPKLIPILSILLQLTLFVNETFYFFVEPSQIPKIPETHDNKSVTLGVPEVQKSKGHQSLFEEIPEVI